MRERHQNSHRTTTRAIQHAQSHKRVARARAMVSCVRPGVQYLDATPGGQWATTPPLQLRGWARVWSVKHSQRVAQAHVRFSRNMSIENVKNTFYLGFSHFFVGVYKVLRLPWKISPNEPEASEVPHLPQGISIMSKIKNDDTFSQNETFRSFQNVVQFHEILRLPCKMTSKSASHFHPYHAGHANEKVSDVSHLSRLNSVLDLKMPQKCHARHQKWT